EQLAEDRDERAGERGVSDEGAHEIRDLNRDRECVDEARDAEEVGAHHLADEPEDAGDRGRRREHRRRAGETATVRPPAFGVDFRCGRLGHALRFSQWGLLPSRGPLERAFSRMANIKQQKKRVLIQERQRTENLRYRSTIKTLTKRLEAAVSDGD